MFWHCINAIFKNKNKPFDLLHIHCFFRCKHMPSYRDVMESCFKEHSLLEKQVHVTYGENMHYEA
jgi:hypothetical protein